MKQLIVNGCSYAAVYAGGSGHIALAKQLGMDNAVSLALGGSTNSRILRTTAKHIFANSQPSLYIVHMTFLSRWEIPVAVGHKNVDMSFEGRWVNPQKQGFEPSWQWTEKDTAQFMELNFKSVIGAERDLFEDMLYRYLSLMALAQAHGHRILLINQCDPTIKQFAETEEFHFLDQHKEFVHRLTWICNFWQQDHRVPETVYDPGTTLPPPEFRHRMPGHYHLVNEYLCNYIEEHKILQ